MLADRRDTLMYESKGIAQRQEPCLLRPRALPTYVRTPYKILRKYKADWKISGACGRSSPSKRFKKETEEQRFANTLFSVGKANVSTPLGQCFAIWRVERERGPRRLKNSCGNKRQKWLFFHGKEGKIRKATASQPISNRPRA